MKSGTYKITIGNRFYIGSSNRLCSRKSCHLVSLKKGTHPNRVMQRTYNKYQNFKFEVIAKYPEEEIRKEEQILIDVYKHNPLCMNISTDAISFLLTPESRKKTIERNKARIWTPAQRAAAAERARGRKHCPESLAERSKKFKGSGNPNAKLSAFDIVEISRRRSRGETIDSLAFRYSVDRTTIQRVCAKEGVYYKPKTWSAALREAQRKATERNPNRYKRKGLFGSKNGRAKLTETDISEIRRQISHGLKLTEIAQIYNVTPEAIGSIKSGRNWAKLKPDAALIAEFGRRQG